MLDAEVEEHFERSQRVLSELVNAERPGPGRRWRAIVRGRRISWRPAGSTGGRPTRSARPATSELLEDLERVLLDVANSRPDPTPRESRERGATRIDQQDLVFRLRVVGAELRRRQGPATPTF